MKKRRVFAAALNLFMGFLLYPSPAKKRCFEHTLADGTPSPSQSRRRKRKGGIKH
jgi:hypothetical protein